MYITTSRRLNEGWLSGFVLLLAAGTALWPLVVELDLTVEDGYFYLRIAQNLAQGAGSTFDGVNATNGYHPLWLLCLVPVFGLVADAALALAWVHLLQGVLMWLACLLLHRTVSRLLGSVAAMVAVLTWIILTHRVWWSGLEFTLHTLCLLGVLYVYVRWFGSGLPERRAPYLLLGGSCSLMLLARIDTALLAALVHLALLPRVRRSPARWPAIQGWLVSAGSVVGTGALYLGTNQLLFGHAVPVSGWIKRSWSVELLAQDPLVERFGWWVAKAHYLVVPLARDFTHPSILPLGMGLVSIAVWLALAWGSHRRGNRDLVQTIGSLLPWLGYGALQYLMYSLSFHGSLRFSAWYYVVQPLLGAILLGFLAWRAQLRLASLLPRHKERVRAALAVGMALAGGLWIGLGLFRLWQAERLRPLRPLREAARWSRQHLPAEARIGSFNPGALGYFSERSVVSLDGLVNSWGFALVERHDLCRYWQEARITHLVDLFRGEEAMAPVSTWSTYAACAAELELLWVSDRYDPTWSVRAYEVNLPSP